MAETPPSRHHHILRATAVIGGASVLNIAVGLLRNKTAALLLGPAGVGLVGLLMSLVATISGIAGLGVGSSAVRQIARDADPRQQAATQRTLQRLAGALAIAGGLATWLLRHPLATTVMGVPAAAAQVGWLAVAVALTIWSSGQLAVLNGLRRLRDLAAAQVLGGVLGTVMGVAALVAWHDRGVVAYVIAAPLAMVVTGAWLISRLPRPAPVVARFWASASPMLRLGVPMMLGGIMLSVGSLAIRAVLARRVGVVGLGAFTAAWTLSVTYIGFVLSAMGTDYLPRLTAVIDDRAAACRSINDQAEIGLLLALPVMLAMQAAVPWIIWLLYSSRFADAAGVLRWLVIADVMKLASWPLGFVLIAQARAKTFLALEVATLGVTLGMVALLLERVGLPAAGIAYCVTYLWYAALVAVLVHRSLGWRPSHPVLGLVVAGILMVGITGLIGAVAALPGLILGGVLAIGTGGYSLHRLARLGALPAAVQRFIPGLARA